MPRARQPARRFSGASADGGWRMPGRSPSWRASGHTRPGAPGGVVRDERQAMPGPPRTTMDVPRGERHARNITHQTCRAGHADRRQRRRLDRARARPHRAWPCWPTADLHGAADPRDTGRDAAGARRGRPLHRRRGPGPRAGHDELRTALEREIVAIGHRPETIRDADAQRPDGRGGAAWARGPRWSAAGPRCRRRARRRALRPRCTTHGPDRAGRPAGSRRSTSCTFPRPTALPRAVLIRHMIALRARSARPRRGVRTP